MAGCTCTQEALKAAALRERDQKIKDLEAHFWNRGEVAPLSPEGSHERSNSVY